MAAADRPSSTGSRTRPRAPLTGYPAVPAGAIPQQREETGTAAPERSARRGPVVAATIGVVVLLLAAVAVASMVTRGARRPVAAQPMARPSAPSPAYYELPAASPLKRLRREYGPPARRDPGDLSPVLEREGATP